MSWFRRLSKYAVPAAAILVCTTSSCGHESKKSATVPPWAISFRWSAEPGVDLNSNEIRMVRAAIESNTIATYLSVAYGYPGWQEASDHSVDVDAYTPHAMTEGIGTAYLHIIPLPTPGGTRDIVCKDMTGTARKVGNNYPIPDPAKPLEGLDVIAVDVAGISNVDPATIKRTETPSGPEIPGPPYKSARPKSNVFSQFTFVSYPHGGSQYRDLCNPWTESRWGGPQPPKPTRTENEPPKIEPFTPGWAE